MAATMTVEFFTYFSAVTAVVFAARGASSRPRPAVLVAAFAMTVLALVRLGLPGTAPAGLLGAALAAAVLTRRAGGWPGVESLIAAAAGAFAALWAVSLAGLGLPLGVTAATALALVAMAMWGARRVEGFAPPAVLEEALLLVIGLGSIVAAAPALAAGWRTARVLNAEGVPAQVGGAGWVGALLLGSMLAGGLVRWVRRGR